MIFKSPVDFKQLFDFGLFDNIEIEGYRGAKPPEFNYRLIRHIVYDYFYMKVEQSIKTGLPVSLLNGGLMFHRYKGKQNYQLIEKKDKTVYRFQKQDIYKRQLKWWGSLGQRGFILRYERTTRKLLKKYKDLGLDIPLNNYDNERSFCSNKKNFEPGGRYDTRTPLEQRTTFDPEPYRGRRKKASH